MSEDSTAWQVLVTGVSADTLDCLNTTFGSAVRFQTADPVDVPAAIAGGGYSAAILTWVLGGEDGTRALMRMRTQPEGRNVPVIFVLDPALAGNTVEQYLKGLSVASILPHPAPCEMLAGALRDLGLTRPADAGSSPDAPLTLSGDSTLAEDAGGESESGAGERTVSHGPGTPAAPVTSAVGQEPLVMVVSDNCPLVDPILDEIGSRGVRTTLISSLSDVPEAILADNPGAVLLDLDLGASQYRDLTFLEQLCGRFPALPVAVLTAHDGLGDRVAVASVGGRGYLKKTLPPIEVADAVLYLMDESEPGERRVLVVGHDPILLAGIKAYLHDYDIQVTTLADPLRFWDVLEQGAPDVLVLDLDGPTISGADLCRAVRTDSRWSALSVLFLTDDRQPATIQRVFEAGGDDLVSKAALSPELTLRILNRLQRAELFHRFSEVDPLTGIANRRKATETVRSFIGLAQRQNIPMTVAILDIDDFKVINDEFGHPVGDAVLRHLARVLTRSFRRSADVIARWGGEEFLVGMYGVGKAQTVDMLRDVLRQVGRNSPLGQGRRLTFSAGVAEFPQDGRDVLDLYRSADRAELRAKALGKDRVIAVNWEDLLEE